MMRMACLIGGAAVLMLLTGCSTFMGGLRRDLDDSSGEYGPTVGGAWPESGMLAPDELQERWAGDRYMAVGHSERHPAGVSYEGEVDRGSWLAANEAEGAAAHAYGSTPDLAPPVQRVYKNGDRATRADFVDDMSNEGSLWASDGQTNYFFTKNKIRGVGDILTINVEDQLIRDVSAEVKRTLSEGEREAELALAQQRIRARTLGLPDPSEDGQAAPKAQAGQPPAAQRAPAEQAEGGTEEIVIPAATYDDVDVSKSIKLAPGDKIMGEIVERYSNGNYKVRATRRVPYRGTVRNLAMVGIVKNTEISDTDEVGSGKLYEYQIKVYR